jgi:hypothetical protein
MTVRLAAIAVAATDPGRVAEFWRELLGWATDEGGVAVVSSDPRDFRLRFRHRASPKLARNPHHLHRTSETAEHQQRTVARAVALGARHIDVGQRPEEEHVVLADPEDNEFCVIEPGNRWLAGCGFLAELACDGSREVGLFWSSALGWPLIWDVDGETAVRTPGEGPKLAWGGPPPMPRPEKTRIWFELAPGAAAAVRDEVDRLVALGARVVRGLPDGGVVLADPADDEFRLLPDDATRAQG